MTPPVGASSIAAAVDGNGATNLFTIDGGGQIQLYTMPVVANKTLWNPMQALGQPTGSFIATGPPAVGSNPGGRLELFVTDGTSIFHIYQNPSGGVLWSGWESIGSPAPSGSSDASLVGAPVVVADATGRLCVFVCGQNSTVYWSTQAQPGQGPWKGLGTPFAAPRPRGRGAGGRARCERQSGCPRPGRGNSLRPPAGPRYLAQPVDKPRLSSGCCAGPASARRRCRRSRLR